MKVKITNISVRNADKSGQAYKDKELRPYNRVGIQTEQHGKSWLGGFAYPGSPMLSWKIGDEVEIETKQNGQYLNFSLPKQGGNNGFLIAEMKRMNQKLDEILDLLKDFESIPQIEGQEAPQTTEELPPF